MIVVVSILVLILSFLNFIISFIDGPSLSRKVAAGSILLSILLLIVLDVLLTKNQELKTLCKSSLVASKIMLFLIIIISLLGIFNNYGFPQDNPY